MTEERLALSRPAASVLSALGQELASVEPLYGEEGSVFYDRTSRNDLSELREFSRLSSTHPGQVLDLGCGSGRVSLHLARRRTEVTALDNSPAMIAILRSRLSSEPPAVAARVHPVLSDMAEYDGDSSFSLIVVSVTTIGLLTSAQRAEFFSAARRLLLPDGALAMTTATFAAAAGALPSAIDVQQSAVLAGDLPELLTISQTIRPSQRHRSVTLMVSPLIAAGRDTRFYSSSVNIVEPDELITEAHGAGLTLHEQSVISRVPIASADAYVEQVVTMLVFGRAER